MAQKDLTGCQLEPASNVLGRSTSWTQICLSSFFGEKIKIGLKIYHRHFQSVKKPLCLWVGQINL